MRDKDCLSIKSFSELSGVKETTLRYWDQLGIFTPGIRSESGHRYYLERQLITINAIKVAESMGVTVKELTHHIPNRTPELALDVLNKKAVELGRQRDELERTYDAIQAYRRIISLGIYMSDQDISVRFHEDTPIAFGAPNDWSHSKPGNFFKPLVAYYETAEENNIDPRFPVGGFWPSWQSFCEDPDRPERFFAIDPKGTSRRASGLYLTSFTQGDYGGGKSAKSKMREYLKEHNLEPTGPVYCVYLLDEVSVRESDEYLMQTSVSLGDLPAQTA